MRIAGSARCCDTEDFSACMQALIREGRSNRWKGTPSCEPYIRKGKKIGFILTSNQTGNINRLRLCFGQNDATIHTDYAMTPLLIATMMTISKYDRVGFSCDAFNGANPRGFLAGLHYYENATGALSRGDFSWSADTFCARRAEKWLRSKCKNWNAGSANEADIVRKASRLIAMRDMMAQDASLCVRDILNVNILDSRRFFEELSFSAWCDLPMYTFGLVDEPMADELVRDVSGNIDAVLYRAYAACRLWKELADGVRNRRALVGSVSLKNDAVWNMCDDENWKDTSLQCRLLRIGIDALDGALMLREAANAVCAGIPVKDVLA